MLYDPEAHEPLVEEAWDDARARDAVQRIATEAANASGPDGFWPVHPLDEDPSVPPGRYTLYEGAAGLLWALGSVVSTGHADVPLDLVSAIEGAAARYPDEPDYGERSAGLWAGESGIALVAHGLTGNVEHADRLLALVRENETSPTNEVMWGAPGTMLAAHTMHHRTGDERFAEAWAAGASRLLTGWPPDGFWVQHLYGKVTRYVGPAHGFAGVVRVLAQGSVADAERVAAALEATVEREGNLANWRPDADRPFVVNDTIRTQWCHGAPGMVASLWDVAPRELMLAGGELTWTAGPLRKGANLCHGTAGNGYAFLKLFALTGDEEWLARARAFAMHSLAQVDRARDELGRGRFSLFTGDLGTALYVRSCLDGTADFPTIDAW